MSSTAPASQRVPFRVFSCPLLHDSSPVALGRNHSSWFVVYATPHFSSGRRAGTCVNYVSPGDPCSVGAVSPTGKPLFTTGAQNGQIAIDVLLCILAEIEVHIPEDELVYACARCGRWETLHGPRFLRCSGCKNRYYCSSECQKQDWRPSYHRDECALLKAGNAFQVEDRRKRNDNGWWFDHGYYGDYSLLMDNGEWMYARALETLDYDFPAYGRGSPPRDVPPTATSPAPLLVTRDDRPLGFIPTDGALDHYFVRHYRFRNSPALTKLSHSSLRAVTPNNFARSSVPAYPALPDIGTSGAVSRPPFIVTGDTAFDECRLYGYVQQHGTQAERDAVAMYGHLRAANIAARRKLADVQKARVQGNVKLLAAHLLAAEDVSLLAAGDDPAARFESFTMKQIYTGITADNESRS